MLHLGLFLKYPGPLTPLLHRIKTRIFACNMLERLGNILGHRPSTLSSPFLARLFSVSRKRGTKPKSETVEDYNARRRLRYNNDAAYREARLAHARAWQAQNPEKAKLSSRDSKKTSYKQNPVFRQKQIARRLRAYHEVYKHDPLIRLRRHLRLWMDRQADFMSALPWKTHSPQMYEASIEHLCQSCRRKVHGGSRLWWHRLGSDDQYDCHPCYVQDADASMPEGYEGITTWRDMVARKDELDSLEQNDKSKP